MKSSSDSPCPGRLTRRTATVTISAPDASMASRMFSNDGYLPVPTMSRDLNSLPPSQSDVSYMAWLLLSRLIAGRAPDGRRASAPAHGPDDLHPVTVAQHRVRSTRASA